MKENSLVNNPKISVVTPNYNYSEYIGKTIESILNQDYDNIEHIIIDDGSKDNSIEIIERYAAIHPDKIKLIKQENRGRIPAINRGLKEVTGDIICWINSDDLFEANVMGNIALKFINDNELDILIGDVNVIDLNGNFIYRIRHLKPDKYFAYFFGFSKILTSNAVFWRKELLDRTGFFEEKLKVNMDGEYFSRLCRNARSILHLSIPFASFRKQYVSKAGVDDPFWNKKVQDEIQLEIENSLKYLKKSTSIPVFVFPIFKNILFLKRVVKKLFSIIYLLEAVEKYEYRKKNKD